MSKEDAMAKIKAVAWNAAAELGWREAIRLLNEVAAETEGQQWSGAGNR
jgi:hypothetical protein